jgi:hypothetical protein
VFGFCPGEYLYTESIYWVYKRTKSL